MKTQNNHLRHHSLGLAAAFASLAFLAAAGCSKRAESKTEHNSDERSAQSAIEGSPANVAAEAETPRASSMLAEAKGSYEIDGAHSSVNFRAKHFGVAYTYGRFNKVSGSLVIDPDLSKSRVSIEVDAGSVFTAVKKRDDHLKSPDFLNAKQFPKIKFESTEVTAAGDNEYVVTGKLSLHGVTRQVSATFEHVGVGEHPMNKSLLTGFHGELTIKRSDFDMSYMQGALSDEIHLLVSIEAVRQ